MPSIANSFSGIGSWVTVFFTTPFGTFVAGALILVAAFALIKAVFSFSEDTLRSLFSAALGIFLVIFLVANRAELIALVSKLGNL